MWNDWGIHCSRGMWVVALENNYSAGSLVGLRNLRVMVALVRGSVFLGGFAASWKWSTIRSLDITNSLSYQSEPICICEPNSKSSETETVTKTTKQNTPQSDGQSVSKPRLRFPNPFDKFA